MSGTISSGRRGFQPSTRRARSVETSLALVHVVHHEAHGGALRASPPIRRHSEKAGHPQARLKKLPPADGATAHLPSVAAQLTGDEGPHLSADLEVLRRTADVWTPHRRSIHSKIASRASGCVAQGR
jgi:hypothetical protein